MHRVKHTRFSVDGKPSEAWTEFDFTAFRSVKAGIKDGKERFTEREWIHVVISDKEHESYFHFELDREELEYLLELIKIEKAEVTETRAFRKAFSAADRAKKLRPYK